MTLVWLYAVRALFCPYGAGTSGQHGQVLLILEAMKMENEIVAPQDGTVATINVAVGDSVEPGATLATLN